RPRPGRRRRPAGPGLCRAWPAPAAAARPAAGGRNGQRPAAAFRRRRRLPRLVRRRPRGRLPAAGAGLARTGPARRLRLQLARRRWLGLVRPGRPGAGARPGPQRLRPGGPAPAVLTLAVPTPAVLTPAVPGRPHSSAQTTRSRPSRLAA